MQIPPAPKTPHPSSPPAYPPSGPEHASAPGEYTGHESAEGPHEVFRPVLFGEALFDHFPDGTRALGGAPFNVAWHLQGFKARPLLLSAVGRDAAGEEILTRMAAWGMETEGIQLHPSRPTGTVTAELDAGEPHFRIEPRQAYDQIDLRRIPPTSVLAGAHLLYHGTLALRETTSRSTLDHLRESLGAPVLVDVNLRDPWWSKNTVRRAIKGAFCVKLNEGELALLSARRPVSAEARLEAAQAFRQELGIRTLVVTMGSEGAVALRDGEAIRREAPPSVTVVDTVGAGDGFSAVVALGLHHQWPMEVTLERAVAFAAEVCTVRGASPSDPDLYARHLGRWRHGE